MQMENSRSLKSQAAKSSSSDSAALWWVRDAVQGVQIKKNMKKEDARSRQMPRCL